jgi:small subunit ribosomal protein S8
MSVTDPIADALTKIRNAYRAGHKQVTVNYSNINAAVIKVLSDENFINSFEVVERTSSTGTRRKYVSVYLRYTNTGKSVISGIERISRPGRRVYVKADNLPRVLNNIGCAVLSTSRGLMVDRQARKEKIGGEYICKVW